MDRLLTNLVAGVWLIVALLGNTSTTHAAQDKQQPNVIVFLADDQGFGDYGFQGNPDLETPHLDSMARNGALFETFLVCPVCSPTRAEFLTGRYSARSGVVSTSAGGERMALGEQTVAELFRESGYATAAFGKWHNGMQYPYHPLGRGFDEFYGFCSGHWGNYFSPILEHNGQLVRGEGFVVDDFTSKAISFIEQHQDQPFFVYLPYNTPHSPMQVPDAYWERFEEKEITLRSSKPERENLFHTRAALAMCENIDWNVGRVLTTLDDLNIAEETIVLYFSDNGPNGLRFNGGLKGRKGSTDEGGVRSPLLMQWNGTIEPGTRVQQLAGAIDLLPTLVDLCQLEVEPRNPLDGISLKPFVLDEAAPLVDREIVTFWKGRASLRNQDFRLDNDGNLFHLAEDPGQTTVVSENFPEVHERLTDLLNIARAQMDPRGLDIPEEPFPVGHSDFAFTQLPARDAQVTGAIRRSNRFPNCSYFGVCSVASVFVMCHLLFALSVGYRIEVG
ncbi:MAG: arylsulfatase [Planctomycetota bacterium]